MFPLCILRMRTQSRRGWSARALLSAQELQKYLLIVHDFWNKFRHSLCKVITYSPRCWVNLIFIIFSIFTWGTITTKYQCYKGNYHDIQVSDLWRCPDSKYKYDIRDSKTCPISFRGVPFHFSVSWLANVYTCFHQYSPHSDILRSLNIINDVLQYIHIQ